MSTAGQRPPGPALITFFCSTWMRYLERKTNQECFWLWHAERLQGHVGGPSQRGERQCRAGEATRGPWRGQQWAGGAVVSEALRPMACGVCGSGQLSLGSGLDWEGTRQWGEGLLGRGFPQGSVGGTRGSLRRGCWEQMEMETRGSGPWGQGTHPLPLWQKGQWVQQRRDCPPPPQSPAPGEPPCVLSALRCPRPLVALPPVTCAPAWPSSPVLGLPAPPSPPVPEARARGGPGAEGQRGDSPQATLLPSQPQAGAR